MKALAKTLLATLAAVALMAAGSGGAGQEPGRNGPAKLKVVVHWDDATDVDLHVLEPGAVLCFFNRPVTTNGGKLIRDLRQGPGDEVYEIDGGPAGEYAVSLMMYDRQTERNASTNVKVWVYRNGVQIDYQERTLGEAKHVISIGNYSGQ